MYVILLRMDHSDSPGVIALPPLIYLAGLIAGLLLHWLKPLHFLPQWWTGPVGLSALVLAAVMALTAKRALKLAQTNVDPRQPTTCIVTTGPYRLTRNPLYLSLVLIVLGVACAVNALWIVITLIPVLMTVHFGVIKREETYLTRKFGSVYRDYQKRVRRWI